MKRFLPFLACVLVTAASAHAIPVKYTNMGPNKTFKITVDSVTSNVYTGVMNVTVGDPGTTYAAFCIDPFQLANTGWKEYSQTEFSDLTNPAPNSSPVLSAAQIETIEKLWAVNYNEPLTDKFAAQLQLAIWMVVGGNAFSFTQNHGITTTMVQDMIAIANAQESRANLTRLSSSGYQDYVYFDLTTPNTPTTPTGVPDAGSTAAMLGLAMGAMFLFARRRQLTA